MAGTTAGLPTVLVATSTRCRGDVCAHARATRSASAANLRAIEGDMCARECRVREPPPLVRKRFSTTLDAPRSINKFRPASQPKSDEDIVRPNNWRVEAPVWTAREDEFPGEARCRRAACCARSRGPVGEAVEAPRLGRTMVGILRTPAQDSGRSPYHETPGSTRTYDWRRIDHTVRASSGRFQRVATFTGYRAAFGRSNRARDARSAALASQIHHNSLARLDSSPIARHSS